MSASNEMESLMLNLIFLNSAAANIGDAGGLQPSAAPGVFYVSLHSADPGEAGAQNTNEISYTGYGRISVVRSGAQWTVSGTAPTQVANANAVTFGLDTVGSVTASYFGVGSDLAGAGHLFFSGQLTAPLAISPGVTPSFAANQLVVTCD